MHIPLNLLEDGEQLRLVLHPKRQSRNATLKHILYTHSILNQIQSYDTYSGIHISQHNKMILLSYILDGEYFQIEITGT